MCMYMEIHVHRNKKEKKGTCIHVHVCPVIFTRLLLHHFLSIHIHVYMYMYMEIHVHSTLA